MNGIGRKQRRCHRRQSRILSAADLHSAFEPAPTLNLELIHCFIPCLNQNSVILSEAKNPSSCVCYRILRLSPLRVLASLREPHFQRLPYIPMRRRKSSPCVTYVHARLQHHERYRHIVSRPPQSVCRSRRRNARRFLQNPRTAAL